MPANVPTEVVDHRLVAAVLVQAGHELAVIGDALGGGEGEYCVYDGLRVLVPNEAVVVGAVAANHIGAVDALDPTVARSERIILARRRVVGKAGGAVELSRDQPVLAHPDKVDAVAAKLGDQGRRAASRVEINAGAIMSTAYCPEASPKALV